jgi:Rieske 2Fe-2S family protein
VTAFSPVPLPADAVGRVITPEFGAARTLPAEAYRSEPVLAWERRHLFSAGWVCIGRSEDVAGRGDQRAVRVGGEGVVLARDGQGELHAFHNACRHRGHELLRDGECRTRRSIGCPYHGWVYNLDGTLRQASRFSDIPGFDIADLPLQEIRTREWHGWVFVNLSGDARPLEDWLGNLDEYISPWEPERLRVAARHEYVVQANWKLVVENFLECYHCPSIHPELCRVSPPESAEAFDHTGIWIGGPMELRDAAETMSLDGRSGGIRIRGLDDAQARHVHYFAVFPNILISPHPDYVMTHRLQPLSPLETAVECSWLFPPEALELADFDPAFATQFWDVTNQQDFAACESVQRGMSSRGFVPGPFDLRESGVYSLQALVAHAYLTGTIERPRAVDLVVS